MSTLNTQGAEQAEARQLRSIDRHREFNMSEDELAELATNLIDSLSKEWRLTEDTREELHSEAVAGVLYAMKHKAEGLRRVENPRGYLWRVARNECTKFLVENKTVRIPESSTRDWVKSGKDLRDLPRAFTRDEKAWDRMLDDGADEYCISTINLLDEILGYCRDEIDRQIILRRRRYEEWGEISQRLGIHPQTARRRLARIEEAMVAASCDAAD